VGLNYVTIVGQLVDEASTLEGAPTLRLPTAKCCECRLIQTCPVWAERVHSVFARASCWRSFLASRADEFGNALSSRGVFCKAQ
jgi:hypothetical protein